MLPDFRSQEYISYVSMQVSMFIVMSDISPAPP